MICERLEMFPVECVARGYLTGSGLLDYRATGRSAASRCPPGSRTAAGSPSRSSRRPPRPSSATHDENVSYDAVVATVGAEVAAQLRELTLAVYSRAEGIARERGIILADTKLELGARADGTMVLADEVLTPDSSRFWPADEWQPGRTQPSYDKQIVRNWLLSPSPAGTRRPTGRRRRCRPRSSTAPVAATSRRTSC